MKNLALFDVDGTLVESNQFDSECFVEAARRVLEIESIDDDWSHYQHVTDAGVLAEIYQSHFDREIPVSVAKRVKGQFLGVIEHRLLRSGSQLRPLPGAREALAALRRSGEWVIAVAGGGWRESIEKKLEHAGITELDGVPIFSSDDAVSRTEIMAKAMEAMSAKTRADRFGRVVYVGDAIWDLKASADLGVPFLAVGSEAEKLHASGASHAISDYSNPGEFMAALEHCLIPTPSAET